MVFEISEGDVALVARINFVGNESYSDSRLKEVIATREQAWYRLLSSSDTYDPDRLAYDRELLRRFYLRQGFADVEITSGTAELAPDRSGFFLTFTVNEGPRYRIGTLTVTSTLRGLDPASVRGEIPISEGDWYNGDAVERADNDLTDLLAARGFPFAAVEPRITRNREARTVDLAFEISEGPRAYVERIEITGNPAPRTASSPPRDAPRRRRPADRGPGAPFPRPHPQPGLFPGRADQHRAGLRAGRVILNTQITERATGELPSAAAIRPMPARSPISACASATCSAPASMPAST